MILLIDNNDSFTYNVRELLGRATSERVVVTRGRGVTLDELTECTAIVFSPGPGLPNEFPVMDAILSECDVRKPILGICLGHQAICEHYGGRLEMMAEPAHGVASEVWCDAGSRLFRDTEKMTVGRYHSWVVIDAPPEFRVTARDERGAIMAVEHITRPVFGLQFHPESHITQNGVRIIKNFLDEIPR